MLTINVYEIQSNKKSKSRQTQYSNGLRLIDSISDSIFNYLLSRELSSNKNFQQMVAGNLKQGYVNGSDGYWRRFMLMTL